ncbi:helix-turn-helix transcriptional regulator [Aquimarina gracilis]
MTGQVVSEQAKKDYDTLTKYFQKHTKDSIKSKIYAKAFLLKAKLENNISRQADGYYMLATISSNEKALIYADSVIRLTKEKDNYVYPAEAHLLKARIFGSKGEYQKSKDELIQANLYANKNENIDQKFKTKYFIAILKSNLGEYQESSNDLRSIVAYYKNKFDQDQKYEYDYIKSLYALGDAHNGNKKYDSAYAINKKAVRSSLHSKDSSLYGRLLLSSGITHYHKKQYQQGLDSINKLKKISTFRTQSNGTLVRADFFLGKIYFEQSDYEKSIHHLKAVDSFAFSKQYFFPSIRNTYELLIRYYKEQENTEKQLFYIDKLLSVDSILDNDFRYLSRQINEEYSTPNLMLEKQEIINSLEKTNKTKVIFVILLSITSLLLIIILIRNDQKKKTYKNRFLELLNDKNPVVDNTKNTLTKRSYKNEQDGIGISEIIVNDILKNLSAFEKNKEFLTPNLTVSGLSKQFKTNSKYLSKVINIHKNKSFSNYVNELRIGYVVEELKSNRKFRKYTIKAIANEIGFNTTEAFSKSFYKTTGIYPSFFLKQLEKQTQNSKTQEIA